MKVVSRKNLFQNFNKNKNLLLCYCGNNPLLIKVLPNRIPLFFNLYENRLLHSEFLEQVFRDLLEQKEMLTYDFQKKVFSLYLKKVNLKFYHKSFFNQSKILLGILTVFLLVRSFPYQLFVNENKNFFYLYKETIFHSLKTIISMTIILFNKILKAVKTNFKLAQQKLKFLCLQFKKNLFNSYLYYLELTDNLIKISINYKILFSTIFHKQLTNFYTTFEKLLVILSLRQFIVLNSIIKQFKKIES